MGRYCIAADVTLDLPKEEIDRLGLRIISMELTLGDKTYMHYEDERELSTEEFYTKLKEGLPASTTQITPLRFELFFSSILEEGKDIIYISLSSGLSGTYHSSMVAAMELQERYPDRRIHCVDSKCASIGEGLLALLAGEAAAGGMPYEELIEYVENMKTKCCHWFTVEDLQQLKRGGRISAVEAVLGTALKIHPILSTDSEGKLRVVTKVRGMKKAIDYLMKRLNEDAEELSDQTLIVAHGNCVDYVDMFIKTLKSRVKCKRIVVSKIGPVIGSHTGTGMLALTFVGDNYKE